MFEDILWWVAEEKRANDACLSLRLMYVFPSISAPGARAADSIGTLEVPFDSPEWRKDDGVDRGTIGAIWHLARATAVCTNPCKKLFCRGCRPNHWMATTHA